MYGKQIIVFVRDRCDLTDGWAFFFSFWVGKSCVNLFKLVCIKDMLSYERSNFKLLWMILNLYRKILDLCTLRYSCFCMFRDVSKMYCPNCLQLLLKKWPFHQVVVTEGQENRLFSLCYKLNMPQFLHAFRNP